MRPQVGQIISGKYRLTRLIGEGGMGSVFEAQHEYLGSAVALKFLNPELAQRSGLVMRFLQEARVSASIRSPHVVQVSDVDQSSEGLPYLVMELLEGQSLQEVITRSRRLTMATALDYAVQILNGLEAAHARGIVHRDLKPDNVFIVSTNHGPLIKLVDFGIAKLCFSEEMRGLTRPGALMGTPEYMAPEQAFSADQVDHRADLFSLGVILFEMIAGSRPVAGDDPRVLAANLMTGNVRRLRDLVPTIPQGLADVVHKALAPRADDRFASAGEMRGALLPFFTASAHAAGLQGYPSVIAVTPQPPQALQGPSLPSQSGRPPPTQPDAEPSLAGGVASTLPPDEPEHVPAFRTGTVLGDGPSVNVGAERSTALGPGYGATAEMDPMAFRATAPDRTPAAAYGAAPIPAMAPRKRSRSGLTGLGIVAAVLGALAAVGGIAFYLAWAQDSGESEAPFLPATVNPPATVTAEPVSPTTPAIPPGVPTATPPATRTATPTRRDGGADAGAEGGLLLPDASFPFPIPSSLPPFPSSLPPFPSSIPSGFIPPIPIPSGLPTFPIPGWPPPRQ